jgi:hypothetical protein
VPPAREYLEAGAGRDGASGKLGNRHPGAMMYPACQVADPLLVQN